MNRLMNHDNTRAVGPVVIACGPMTFPIVARLAGRSLDGVATSLPGIDLMRYGAVGFAYAAPSQPGRPLARCFRRDRMDGACR